MEIEGYVILCFGAPITSVGARLAPLTPISLPLLPMDQAEVWGVREGKGYVILCFAVPTTSVGARG